MSRGDRACPSATFSYTVRMRHIDAASVTFFARWFEIAHDAYEEFLDLLGMPLDLSGSPILPIVHADADYHASIALGDRIDVRVEVTEVRRSSFTLAYAITAAGGVSCGTLRTVHVAVDRIGGRVVPLPDPLRSALGG